MGMNSPTRSWRIHPHQIAMAKSLLGRFAQLLFVMLAVSLLTFLILSATPGNIVDARIGPLPNFSPEERERIVESLTKQLGLDKPLWQQYFLWLKQVLQGDFGFTYQGLKVTDLIGSRLWPTIELGFLSVVTGVLGSLMVSLLAFRTRFRAVRGAVQGSMTLLLVMPAFWLGLILVIVGASKLNWLPAAGYVEFSEDKWEHIRFLILPVLTLALPQIALFFRYLYSGLRDAENSAFVTASRARGISERAVVYRHILPNAALPTITVIGLVAGSLISGLVIVETVFSWPGLGALIVKSVEVKDYNTVAAAVLLTAFSYVVVAFIVDIIYQLVDPRTRRKS
ncbi:MAG: ABC transporter permease [Acidimicrobiaceae bacterium]|nr:ABC transporter permease [Acidimicrobiaceae bacterium]